MKIIRIQLVGEGESTAWPFADDVACETARGALSAALLDRTGAITIEIPGIVATWRADQIQGFSVIDMDDPAYLAHEIAYGVASAR